MLILAETDFKKRRFDVLGLFRTFSFYLRLSELSKPEIWNTCNDILPSEYLSSDSKPV
jgi:hypothetical protein